MLPSAEAGVIERNVFKQFNVGGKADARVSSFNQIVTEKGLSRKPVAQNGVEGNSTSMRLPLCRERCPR